MVREGLDGFVLETKISYSRIFSKDELVLMMSIGCLLACVEVA